METFGEKLLDQARAARAESETKGDFLFADGGASEQHAGNVGAGNEKNQPDESEHDKGSSVESAVNFGKDLNLIGGNDDRATVLIGIWVLKSETFGDGFQFRQRQSWCWFFPWQDARAVAEKSSSTLLTRSSPRRITIK